MSDLRIRLLMLYAAKPVTTHDAARLLDVPYPEVLAEVRRMTDEGLIEGVVM